MTNVENEWYSYILPTVLKCNKFYTIKENEWIFDKLVSEEEFGDEYSDIIEYILVEETMPEDVLEYMYLAGLEIPAEPGYYYFDWNDDKEEYEWMVKKDD